MRAVGLVVTGNVVRNVMVARPMAPHTGTYCLPAELATPTESGGARLQSSSAVDVVVDQALGPADAGAARQVSAEEEERQALL